MIMSTFVSTRGVNIQTKCDICGAIRNNGDIFYVCKCMHVKTYDSAIEQAILSEVMVFGVISNRIAVTRVNGDDVDAFISFMKNVSRHTRNLIMNEKNQHIFDRLTYVLLRMRTDCMPHIGHKQMDHIAGTIVERISFIKPRDAILIGYSGCLFVGEGYNPCRETRCSPLCSTHYDWLREANKEISGIFPADIAQICMNILFNGYSELADAN